MGRVIVLGATGFIGSHVAEQLHLAGHEPQALVRPTANTTFLRSLGISITTVDFTNTQKLATFFHPDDIVINCIAHVKVHQTLAALRQQQVAVLHTITNALLKANVSHHLLLSSVEVYGFRGAPIKRENSLYQPEFAFQQALVEREQAFVKLMQSAGAAYAILQPASTIGRREMFSSFFAKLHQAHTKKLYPLVDSGKAHVSLVDTRDIGRAMVWLVQQARFTNDTYLLKGYDTTWREVKRMLDEVRNRRAWSVPFSAGLLYPYAKLLEHVLPYSCEPTISPLSIKLVSQDVWIDDAKIRSTGFQPLYGLRDSVQDALLSLEPQLVS
jgi:dihydroflavonol-4-reductase